MPSYMTIVVLALAASNVPVALAAPIQEVREQSLSRRDIQGSGSTPPPGTPPKGTPPQGYPPPDYPPPDHPPPHYPPSAYRPYGPPNGPGGPSKVKIHLNVVPGKAVAKGSNVKQYAMNFVVGTVATVLGVSLLKGLWGSGSSSKSSAPASSPTSSTSPNNQYTPYPSSNPNPYYNPTSTPQTGQNQYGQNQYYGQSQNQRRAEDHGKRTVFFGPSEAKLGSISDNNRRATSHLELLSRSDSGKALELSSRVPDDLD